MGRRKPSWKKATPLLLTAAVGLLAASAAGSSRAALTYYSENYTAQIEMYDIGVTLVENGRDVSWRNRMGSPGKAQCGRGVLRIPLG